MVELEIFLDYFPLGKNKFAEKIFSFGPLQFSLTDTVTSIEV